MLKVYSVSVLNGFNGENSVCHKQEVSLLNIRNHEIFRNTTKRSCVKELSVRRSAKLIYPENSPSIDNRNSLVT